MIFIGNGTYQPADGLPLARESLAEGQLDVRYLRADVRGARIRAALAMTTGRLSRSRDYVRQLAAKVTVAVEDEVSLATDGEVAIRGRQFEFAAMPGAIRQFVD
jgi:undecaprenyl-diphosphatase